LIGVQAAHAQATEPPPEPEAVVQEAVDPDPFLPGQVGPLGAFLRAVAVPGWGHASVGAHGRGGFYVTTQAVTGYMLVRTRSRLHAAEELRALREAAIRADLAATGVTDEILVQAALEGDAGWAGAERLAGARQQQFEDWLALGIFTVLLGGADALVSAHLQNFPDVSLTPVSDEGRMEFRVAVPVGGG
jgi:hypothetical protein